MIKPIPQLYRGIQYRSKLEACWAAFFHHLGVLAEYELDGFELPSGRYLPDFFLPDIRSGVFVEVKPYDPPFRSRRLCGELACGTGRDVLLVTGKPPSAGVLFAWVRTTDGAKWFEDDRCWRFCVLDERPNLVRNGQLDDPAAYRAAYNAHRDVRWDAQAARIASANEVWKHRHGA